MKKIFTIFFINFIILVSAQNYLSGIGIFQIDKTHISVIDSLKTQGFIEEKCRTNYDCVRNTAGMKVILTPLENQVDRPLIENHKVYWISHYKIVDIDISDMKLNFYDDILYSIEIDGSDYNLLDALKEKYKNTESRKYKNIKCTSIFGDYTQEENETITNFSQNKNYKAINESQKYYNDDCEAKYLSILTIKNIIVANKVRKLEREVYLKQEKVEKESNLEKYKDL